MLPRGSRGRQPLPRDMGAPLIDRRTPYRLSQWSSPLSAACIGVDPHTREMKIFEKHT
jgi:hypothetical protein